MLNGVLKKLFLFSTLLWLTSSASIAVMTTTTLIISPVNNYGNIVVGASTPSFPQTITITNNGGVDASVCSVNLSGAGASQFSLTGSCPSIAVGAPCSVVVTGVPSVVGPQTATLTASCANVTTSPSVILSETGANWPTLSVNPVTYDFGLIPANENRTTTVTINNNAPYTLPASGCTVSWNETTDFSASGSPCTSVAGTTSGGSGS